jgi:protein TonB
MLGMSGSGMTKVVAISAIVHVALVVLLPLAPRIARRSEPVYEVYAVELVDVAAPEAAPAVEQTVEPPPVREEPVVEEAPVEESPAIPEDPPPRARRVVTTPPPREEPSLAERLAERLTPDEEREPAPTESPEPERAREVEESSTRISSAQFADALYLSIVQGKVKRNWRQPSSMLFGERQLTVVVSFPIMRNGTIGPVTVRRSSGRATLDQSAAKAVQMSTPFPELPDSYPEGRLDVTIDFTVTSGE